MIVVQRKPAGYTFSSLNKTTDEKAVRRKQMLPFLIEGRINYTSVTNSPNILGYVVISMKSGLHIISKS